jgi:hypothetical protein
MGLAALGVGLIVWSGGAYSSDTPFPGLAALVPTLGAALIIVSGGHALGRVAFENPASVYIGRISYSLYLTHWPLISFYKYLTLSPLDWRAQLALGAATFATGIVLHHAVEKPFRYGRKISPVYGAGLATAVVLAVPAALAATPSMWNALTQRSVLTYDWRDALTVSSDTVREEREARQVCSLGYWCPLLSRDQFNILVIGDSHGRAGYALMKHAFPDAHISLAALPGCHSFLRSGQPYARSISQRSRESESCRRLTANLYANLDVLGQLDLIVYSYWMDSEDAEMLDETLASLADVAPPILVLGNAPTFTQTLPDIARTLELTPDDPVPANFLDEEHSEHLDQTIERIATRHGAAFVSFRDYFCPRDQCRAWTPDHSRLITYDQHHLSLAAVDAFASANEELIRYQVRSIERRR